MKRKNPVLNNSSKGVVYLFLVFFAVACGSSGAQKFDPILKNLRLPEGFVIEKFASGVKGARAMAIGAKGTLFVGTRGGSVFALVDTDGDYRSDKMHVLATGLNSPNGVAFRNGDLYVGEIHRIIKFTDIESKLENPGDPVVVYDEYPDDTHHGYKYIAFGPDDKLYAPVGAPCNVCLKKNPVYASITRMNPDGSGFEIVANGVRNTVGFDWHPETKELWFTDNGRDMLGDDLPADELNRLGEVGQHFGFPFCHQGSYPDPDFGKGKFCDDYQQPVQRLNPHGAALGMLFYTGDMFPAEYRNQVFICEHGSWNRSKKIGYRVSLVRLDGNEATSFEGFAEGWLYSEDDILGRPVDLLQLPDGSVLVSDDYSGVIYRITYKS